MPDFNLQNAAGARLSCNYILKTSCSQIWEKTTAQIIGLIPLKSSDTMLN